MVSKGHHPQAGDGKIPFYCPSCCYVEGDKDGSMTGCFTMIDRKHVSSEGMELFTVEAFVLTIDDLED